MIKIAFIVEIGRLFKFRIIFVLGSGNTSIYVLWFGGIFI